MEHNPSEESSALTAHFTVRSAQDGIKGPIGEMMLALAGGSFSRFQFRGICARHGVGNEDWFRKQLLDLILGFAHELIQSGQFTPANRKEIQHLRHALEIGDGEFLKFRSAEVAQILNDQLAIILEDLVVDEQEELLQVELQTAFGLSYDDYVALTRKSVETAFLTLLTEARAAEDPSAPVVRKLRALEPLYRMANSRQRTLGALF